MTDAPQDGRAAELARMKLIATGLLVLMGLVYVAASLARGLGPWTGYVRAFAEAGMVGACADWFAVTALFRHPLGIPIPHTGIIPRNKDRIGRALGGFIAENFLTERVLGDRLRRLELARWGGQWLSQEDNARGLARRIAALAPRLLAVLPQDATRELVTSAVLAAARAVPAAPLASRVLASVWNEGRAQVLVDRGLELLADYLAARQDYIEAKVSEQSYKWMPKFIDRILAERISSGLLKAVTEMRAPDHPWRIELAGAVQAFIARLDTDPELQQSAERLKLRLLDDPRLLEQAEAIWTALQARLAADFADPAGGAALRLEQGLLALGTWLNTDEGARRRLNDWAAMVARRGLAPRRHEIGGFVAQVVAGWDAKGVVDKLELQVGRDLQFIRVNGTLVGGLVGLLIYTVSTLLGLG